MLIANCAVQVHEWTQDKEIPHGPLSICWPTGIYLYVIGRRLSCPLIAKLNGTTLLVSCQSFLSQGVSSFPPHNF